MRGSQPWRTNKSRVLRAQPIFAEARLWTRLRNRQLAGLKFVRQAPIDLYFVDFVCRECKVAVEVDGGTHSTDIERSRDRARMLQLQRLGYRVFRVHNVDVYESIGRVLDTLLAFIEDSR